MVLILAEGPSYMFHVAGATREQAMARLRTGFRAHLRQVKAPQVPVEEALSINVIDPFVQGVVYRDYEAL